jgi:hypothetical protein
MTVDELKRVIALCLGEDHESKRVIAQIEHTITNIERKTSLPNADATNRNGNGDGYASPRLSLT